MTLAAIVASYLLVSWVQLLPAPSNLGTQYGHNPGDPLFVMWTMDTAADNLGSTVSGDLADPLRGNIFFPNEDALAYSDNLLAYAPLFGAAKRIGDGNAVFAYNVVFLMTYTAGALAVFALGRWLFESTAVGFLSGLLFTIAPYRSVIASHLQLSGVLFVVLALFFTLRFIRARSMGDAFGVGVAVAGTWYSATYYSLAVGIFLGGVVGVWLLQRLIRPGLVANSAGFPRLIGGGVVAVIVGGLLVAPTFPAYLRLQDSGLFDRDPDNILRAQWFFWRQLPPSWLWSNVAHRECCQGDRGGYYPGLVIIGLVLVVVVWAVIDRIRRGDATAARPAPGSPTRWTEFRVPLLVSSAVFVPLMFGPSLPSAVWDPLTDHVPGFSSLRDTGRFWMIPLLALALVAGRGASRLIAGRSPSVVAGVVAVAAVITMADVLYRPPFAEVDRSPEAMAVYHRLSRLPSGVVTELPVALDNPNWPFTVAPRQFRSLVDRFPRVDGYSGGFPDTIQPVIQAARAAPNADAIRFLQSREVRYLMIHIDEIGCLGTFSTDEAAPLVHALAASPDVVEIYAVSGSESVIVELAKLDPNGPPVVADPAVLPGATPWREGVPCLQGS